MKDYRVTVKVRNNRILNAIESTGGKPGQVWCTENGLDYKMVNNLINMTISPLLKNGEMTDESLNLCIVVSKSPDELWSEEQLYPLETNCGEMEMDHKQVRAMLNEQSYLPDFADLESRQAEKLIGSALDTLSNREQNVIRLRHWSDLTLNAIADAEGVSVERIRQIEKKALRKLRDPKRVEIYADCLDDKDKERFDRRRKICA